MKLSLAGTTNYIMTEFLSEYEIVAIYCAARDTPIEVSLLNFSGAEETKQLIRSDMQKFVDRVRYYAFEAAMASLQNFDMPADDEVITIPCPPEKTEQV